MLRIWACIALLFVFNGEIFSSEGDFIACEVRLTEYIASAPYSEEFDGAYLDFRAPQATLVVASPSKHEGRIVHVVFLSDKHDGTQAELEDSVGSVFIVEIPADYFDYPDGAVIKSYLIESIYRVDR